MAFESSVSTDSQPLSSQCSSTLEDTIPLQDDFSNDKLTLNLEDTSFPSVSWPLPGNGAEEQAGSFLLKVLDLPQILQFCSMSLR